MSEVLIIGSLLTVDFSMSRSESGRIGEEMLAHTAYLSFHLLSSSSLNLSSKPCCAVDQNTATLSGSNPPHQLRRSRRLSDSGEAHYRSTP
jgi:hypothetical protein